jgi:hypothetical protein
LCCEPKCPLLNNFGKYGAQLQRLGVPTSVFAKEATVMRKNYAKEQAKIAQEKKGKEWLTGGIRGVVWGGRGRNRRRSSELSVKIKPGGQYKYKKTNVVEEEGLGEGSSGLNDFDILNALY